MRWDKLDTAFVLPGSYSDNYPVPSVSANGWLVKFPDGTVIGHEAETTILTVIGIKAAAITVSVSITATVIEITVKASTRISPDIPEVVCINKLTTGTLEMKQGCEMRGDIEHTGGTFKSNGV